METENLIEFFEENGFLVHLITQDGVQCAEIERWTDGGVDMIIWLNPFTVNEFKNYVIDFDVDNEIDLHRQDPQYKNVFTISQSLKDFKNFHEYLKQVVTKLK